MSHPEDVKFSAICLRKQRAEIIIKKDFFSFLSFFFLFSLPCSIWRSQPGIRTQLQSQPMLNLWQCQILNPLCWIQPIPLQQPEPLPHQILNPLHHSGNCGEGFSLKTANILKVLNLKGVGPADMQQVWLFLRESEWLKCYWVMEISSFLWVCRA